MKAQSRYSWRPYDQTEPQLRACDHPGCAMHGEFRAPKARDKLNEYFWFCLDHVRAYNAAWDYFAGMNSAEIENTLRHDTTWQRPTWPLGTKGAGEKRAKIDPSHISDPFGVFEDVASEWERNPPPPPRRPRTPEEEAMVTLDLVPPLTVEALKARYKALVKKHHPDANGGDKAAEERFKEINQAYNLLLKNLTA